MIIENQSLRHFNTFGIDAQARYFELMGFQCPAVGGSRELTVEEKEKDAAIRLQISEELGHSRINITSVYLGSWSKK